MKKITFILLALFGIISQSPIEAQLRTYGAPIDGHNENGIYNDDQLVDIYGNPIDGGGNEDFDFVLRYTAFAIVQSLNNEFRRAQQRAINDWIQSQELAMEREIERQLGRSFTNYASAQRAFFDEWVLKSRNHTIQKVRNPLQSRLKAVKVEQQPIASEIFGLDTWWDLNCNSVNGGLCDELRNMRLRNGTLLRNVVQENQFNSNYERAVNDFGRKHYEMGTLRNKIQGISNFSLHHGRNELQGLVNRHISYVNGQSPQRRMLFMLSYLIANNLRVYNQGQQVFTNFSLPTHFRESTVINESKKREPNLLTKYALFAADIVQRGKSACKRTNIYGPRGVVIRTVCSALSATQIRVRGEVLERAKMAGSVLQGNTNFLCGTYDWSTVGKSWTVNVRNVGITIAGRKCWGCKREVITAFIPISCITIPKRTAGGSYISEEIADIKVNLAWESAMVKVYDEIMDKDPRLIDLRKLITRSFDESLKESDGKAKFSQSPCSGNVNTSTAQYVCP